MQKGEQQQQQQHAASFFVAVVLAMVDKEDQPRQNARRAHPRLLIHILGMQLFLSGLDVVAGSPEDALLHTTAKIPRSRRFVLLSIDDANHSRASAVSV